MSDIKVAPAAVGVKHVQILPDDGLNGTLVGRVWVGGAVPGPSVVVLRPEGVFDLSAQFPTMSTLLDTEQPSKAAQEAAGQRLCSVEELVQTACRAPATRPCPGCWPPATCRW